MYVRFYGFLLGTSYWVVVAPTQKVSFQCLGSSLRVSQQVYWCCVHFRSSWPEFIAFEFRQARKIESAWERLFIRWINCNQVTTPVRWRKDGMGVHSANESRMIRLVFVSVFGGVVMLQDPGVLVERCVFLAFVFRGDSNGDSNGVHERTWSSFRWRSIIWDCCK